MTSYQAAPTLHRNESVASEPETFDPNAYISSEYVNPAAIEGVIRSLKETRDLGHTGGCSVDDFSPTTGMNWLNAIAEYYDCEVSGPYLGDVEHGGDYFLFHHVAKPPISQGDLFVHPQDAG